MQTTKTLRDSNFELLRIVAMLCIVICHFAHHSHFDFDPYSLAVPRLWWYFIRLGGDLGVNVFVLISGYFLCTSKSEKVIPIKVLKFWGPIFFYSISIYVICVLTGIAEFELSKLKEYCLPIIYSKWWFATDYFIMYLLHPYFNVLINKLDHKSFKHFVILLLVMWSVIPTITLQGFQINNLLWCFILYFVAGYIRIYGFPGNLKRIHYIGLFILATVLRYLSGIIPIFFVDRVKYFADYPMVFYGKYTLFTFFSSLFLFMVFKETKMGYHKWINIIASASFGVYLIHDNELVRPYLWITLFKGASYKETLKIIPYSIIFTILVYTTCTVIDLIRQATVEKLFLNVVNKIASSPTKQR